MAKSNPVIHGDVVVWQVSEGDIPNAKHFVSQRVDHANELYATLLDEAAEDAAEDAAALRAEILREVEASSEPELDRLQKILDES